MESIEEREKEIVDEFGFFPEWMEKYEHLIELGKGLPIIDDKDKVDDNLIKGCQSKVWLSADLEKGKMKYKADSDALITKGIIALMIRVLNDQTPDAIVKADLSFIDKIGLKEHLSPTRSNGLVSMVKQMKFYALANMAKS